MLAGVGSLALIDDTACSLVDPGNFLVPADVDANSRFVHFILACGTCPDMYMHMQSTLAKQSNTVDAHSSWIPAQIPIFMQCS